MSEPFLLAVVACIAGLTVSACGACTALWIAHERLRAKYDKLKDEHTDCQVKFAEIDAELRLIKQQVSILQAQHQYSDGPMLCVDTKGRIVYWNKEISDLLGFNAAEMLGKSYIEIVPEKYKTFHRKAFKDINDSHRSEYDHTVSGKALTAAETELPVTIRVTMYKLHEVATLYRVKMERRIPFEHDSDSFDDK